jgi:CubicO group peptidase (beta-lactamase class C family)
MMRHPAQASPLIGRPSRGAAILLALLLAAWPWQVRGGVGPVDEATYYPAAGAGWESRAPAQVGLDEARVREAVRLAQANESRNPADLLENHRRSFGREPYGEAVGPFVERGGPTGLILRHGYIVAEWGDPHRVDVTFSVTKSFLTTVVGLAVDRGLIRDVHEPVRQSTPLAVALVGPPSGAAPQVPVPASTEGAATAGPTRLLQDAAASTPSGVAFGAFEVLQPFESEHNRRITWDHLLRQTSDWQGTLWGKPDWADRPQGDPEAWKRRARHEPGTVYAYNDVRVNLLALAAMNVWRRPLPQVLREEVMEPIGASHTWRWYGYDNSWIVLDGQLVQSVSGGAHWGGGLFISARDMARFGLLTLRRGRWGDRQVLSEQWLTNATTPGVNEAYGYMNFFLNTERRALPAAPAEAFYHLGAGTNVIYVDPVNELVVVARWIEDLRVLNAMLERLLAN